MAQSWAHRAVPMKVDRRPRLWLTPLCVHASQRRGAPRVVMLYYLAKLLESGAGNWEAYEVGGVNSGVVDVVYSWASWDPVVAYLVCDVGVWCAAKEKRSIRDTYLASGTQW